LNILKTKELKVKIVSQNYKILFRSKSEDGMLSDGTVGYTLDQNNIIVIDADVAEDKQKVTVLHELLHAIRFINDGMPKPTAKDEFDSWEHFFINLYENNILAILKDNKNLRDWLLENDQA
jgi:Zn-dependent peptidase ImmA (M78 family)